MAAWQAMRWMFLVGVLMVGMPASAQMKRFGDAPAARPAPPSLPAPPPVLPPPPPHQPVPPLQPDAEDQPEVLEGARDARARWATRRGAESTLRMLGRMAGPARAAARTVPTQPVPAVPAGSAVPVLPPPPEDGDDDDSPSEDSPPQSGRGTPAGVSVPALAVGLPEIRSGAMPARPGEAADPAGPQPEQMDEHLPAPPVSVEARVAQLMAAHEIQAGAVVVDMPPGDGRVIFFEIDPAGPHQYQGAAGHWRSAVPVAATVALPPPTTLLDRAIGWVQRLVNHRYYELSADRRFLVPRSRPL